MTASRQVFELAPERAQVGAVECRQLVHPCVPNSEGFVEPVFCRRQPAQLALVAGEIVAHRRGEGKLVHEAQQVGAGTLAGRLHRVGGGWLKEWLRGRVDGREATPRWADLGFDSDG